MLCWTSYHQTRSLLKMWKSVATLAAVSMRYWSLGSWDALAEKKPSTTPVLRRADICLFQGLHGRIWWDNPLEERGLAVCPVTGQEARGTHLNTGNFYCESDQEPAQVANEVVECPPLELFKRCLDKVLGNQHWVNMLGQWWGLDQMTSRGPIQTLPLWDYVTGMLRFT